MEGIKLARGGEEKGDIGEGKSKKGRGGGQKTWGGGSSAKLVKSWQSLCTVTEQVKRGGKG